MRVDSHLHVWRAAEGPTPGVPTMVPPQTDVPISWAEATIGEHHVQRAVLVQPVFRGEDNSYVARCARQQPSRYAAVCVVDPRVARADERLEHWVRQGCRGLRLRPRIAAEAAVFGDPSTFPLWDAARRLGVVVSVLASPEHVGPIGRLAERFAEVPIVIDHLGHPDVVAGVDDPGFRRLLELARYPNVFVKVSGFYHFSRQPFPFADCWPPIVAIYRSFAAERLLWGSDFPHVTLACGYENALALPERALGDWSAPERDAVMGLNAMHLYWGPGGSGVAPEELPVD